MESKVECMRVCYSCSVLSGNYKTTEKKSKSKGQNKARLKSIYSRQSRLNDLLFFPPVVHSPSNTIPSRTGFQRKRRWKKLSNEKKCERKKNKKPCCGGKIRRSSFIWFKLDSVDVASLRHFLPPGMTNLSYNHQNFYLN